MLDDRRKFMRFKILLEVEIKPAKETADYLPGVVINFSRNGFYFVSQDIDFKPKEIVELRVKHPQKNTFVLGEIVWKKRYYNRCFLGIKSREMDKNTKNNILKESCNKRLTKSNTNFAYFIP